jgi:predicted MFS family arabinose efflux permease
MGNILSVAQGVQLAGILLAPFLFRKAGLRNSILLTQLMTGLALFSLGEAHTLIAASCSYWIYTAAQNASEPAIASMLMDRVSVRDRNAASSFNSLVTAGAQIIASTAVGAGIVRFGYSAVLYCIAVLALVAAVLFYRLPQTNPEMSSLCHGPISPAKLARDGEH